MSKKGDFATLLLDWYEDNFRDLPWNSTKDAYKIWLSEIILQQTQVKQGLPYYERFVKAYPDVDSLANAEETDVLKLWEGLGYYSRARNLHKAAKAIVADHNGLFPSDRKTLLTIPGIGPYTSSAIASFAFDKDEAVVDGNVFRVLSRVYDLEDDISRSVTKTKFETLAKSKLRKGRSADFNRAIMNVGSQICRPQNPECAICPFRTICQAFQKNTVQHRPVNSKKIKKTVRHLSFFFIPDKKGYPIVQQRDSRGIWHGLTQLPVLETKAKPTYPEISKSEKWSVPISPAEIETIELLGTVRHLLTHQTLLIHFYEVRMAVNGVKIGPKKLKKVLETHPFPKPIRSFMEDKLLFLKEQQAQ